jgi:hypothetical protein
MMETIMGGRHISGHGTGDDGFDEEGYDESQRAEILEFEREGPTDGTIVTDLDPDLGEDEDLMDDEDEIDGVEEADLATSTDDDEEEEGEDGDEDDR